MQKRNVFLDLFKILLSYFVIGIHYNYSSLYRVAVPMFFMITGYFSYNKECSINRAKKLIKNSLKNLLVAFLIYFIYDIINIILGRISFLGYFNNFFNINNVLNWLLFSVPFTSGFHLWYLIAMVQISFVHYLFIKYKLTYLYKGIIPIFLLIFFIFNGYINLFFEISIYYIYTRNFIFFGLPLFAIGYLLNSNRLKNISLAKTFLLAIIFFILQVFESKIISLECYVSSILAAIFYLLFFVNTNNVVTKNEIFYKLFGKNFSFYIYVVHVIVANALYKYFLWSKVAFHFCIFFVSSLIILLLRSFNMFVCKNRNVKQN